MDHPATSLFAHLIIFTDDLRPLLREEYETGLHFYLGEILGREECRPIAIGGTVNHLHLLIEYSVDTIFDELIRILQQESASWIRSTYDSPDFCWSSDYYCLTTSHSDLEELTAYIENQKLYHSEISLDRELQKIRDAVPPSISHPFDLYRN